MVSTVEIKPARFPQDLSVIQTLFREYADSLDIDLGFQDFEAELSALPGKYATPNGRVLLAWKDSQPAGCVAMRPIDAKACEMKRLYVRPGMRGTHLGARLAARICQEARHAGYARICLDTLPSMSAAVRLYEALGFRPTDPYVFNPIPDAIFLALDLRAQPDHKA